MDGLAYKFFFSCAYEYVEQRTAEAKTDQAKEDIKTQVKTVINRGWGFVVQGRHWLNPAPQNTLEDAKTSGCPSNHWTLRVVRPHLSVVASPFRLQQLSGLVQVSDFAQISRTPINCAYQLLHLLLSHPLVLHLLVLHLLALHLLVLRPPILRLVTLVVL